MLTYSQAYLKLNAFNSKQLIIFKHVMYRLNLLFHDILVMCLVAGTNTMKKSISNNNKKNQTTFIKLLSFNSQPQSIVQHSGGGLMA